MTRTTLSVVWILLVLGPGCSRPAPPGEAPARPSAAAPSPPPPSTPPPGGPAVEKKWTHPGMAMSFSYNDRLLKVSPKPDGATLQSEILGTIEDRSDQGKDRPQPLTITLSVRIGSLDQVRNSEYLGGPPTKVEPIAGRPAYHDGRGSHEAQQDLYFAELPGNRTLQILCDYLGDMGKPTIPFHDQMQACHQVVDTLAFAP